VRPLGIVYRHGRRLYPNARTFVELLQDGGGKPPEGRKTEP